MNSTILLDMMPYSLVEVHRYFGGTHCFHLQGGARNQEQVLYLKLNFLARLVLLAWLTYLEE
jgi:hypothetical protein